MRTSFLDFFLPPIAAIAALVVTTMLGANPWIVGFPVGMFVMFGTDALLHGGRWFT